MLKNNAIAFCVILTCMAANSIWANGTEFSREPKKYSADEKKTEEARIQKDIEEKLDWRNRTKETLDDYDDAHRLLYGEINESILLRKATGERFGIFESFNDQGNEKRFEIRLHKKNKLVARFLSGSVQCDSMALAADEVTENFTLYREVCYRKEQPTYTLYLHDYRTGNLYWMYSNEVNFSKKPVVVEESGIYKLRWDFQIIGSRTKTVLVRNFKIVKDVSGNWVAKSVPPINSELDDITPEKRLPIKSEYDLPSFVADW